MFRRANALESPGFQGGESERGLVARIGGPLLALLALGFGFWLGAWSSGWAAPASAYSCKNPCDGRLWRFREARIWRRHYTELET